MASRRWSRGAASALKLIAGNSGREVRQALDEIDQELRAGGNGRNNAVKSRVLVELWRNGWADAGVLDDAQSFAVCGHQSDEQDFYTHLIAAYALKYRARAQGWGQLAEAMAHYAQAIAHLKADDPTNADALRTVMIDRGETLVYLSQADVAVAEMERALKLGGEPQDWHVWAYGFALHQNGDYRKSVTRLSRLLKGKPASDLYSNDMRLLLAASLARAGKTAEAQRTIRDFRSYRDAAGEPVWTIALELERGAFYPDSPGERHWRESLELLDPQALPR